MGGSSTMGVLTVGFLGNRPKTPVQIAKIKALKEVDRVIEQEPTYPGDPYVSYLHTIEKGNLEDSFYDPTTNMIKMSRNNNHLRTMYGDNYFLSNEESIPFSLYMKRLIYNMDGTTLPQLFRNGGDSSKTHHVKPQNWRDNPELNPILQRSLR